MIDGRLWRKSPWPHKMAVSRLALGRKRRTMAGSSVVGMMGMMGMRGTIGVWNLVVQRWTRGKK